METIGFIAIVVIQAVSFYFLFKSAIKEIIGAHEKEIELVEKDLERSGRDFEKKFNIVKEDIRILIGPRFTVPEKDSVRLKWEQIFESDKRFNEQMKEMFNGLDKMREKADKMFK